MTDDVDQIRRDLARAVGLSPEEPWSVIRARVATVYAEHKHLTEAAAAFRACLEGRAEHVAVRPVCKAPLCDNLPRTNGLCNRCYEQKEGSR